MGAALHWQLSELLDTTKLENVFKISQKLFAGTDC